MRPPVKTLLGATLLVAVVAIRAGGLTWSSWVLPSIVGGVAAAGALDGELALSERLAAGLIYAVVVLLGGVLPVAGWVLWRGLQ